MNCKICGAENSPDAKFCRECGQKLDTAEITAAPKAEAAICQNCGTQNPINAQYCRQCGQSLGELEDSDSIMKDVASIASEAASLGALFVKEAGKAFSEGIEAQAESRNDTICPFCGGENCQPMLKSTMDTTYKNYKWGSGCCGMLLLGPFGLLCGLCGTGAKIKTTNELWWTCLKCGRQHLSLADALKKWDMMMDALLANSVAIGFFLMIIKLIAGWFEWQLDTVLMGIIPLASPIMEIYEFGKEISEDLGGNISSYLSPEQKKACIWYVVISIILIYGIVWFGIPLLGYILGE